MGWVRGAVCAAVALAAAPQVRADTLEQVYGGALSTNASLAARRARLEAVREALPQARSDQNPQLSASASATRTERGGGSGLATGGSSSWSSNLNASQLLFSSGRVPAAVRQARARIAGAEADYTGAVQTLLFDVSRAFADVRQARAAVAAREATVENLTELRRFAAARFEAGVTTRTDLALAEARLAQARTQLVQAQGQLAAVGETYLRLVGAPAAALDPSPAPATLPATLQAGLDTALAQSPTLISAAAAEVAAEAALALAAAGNRPNVTLEAGGGLTGDFEDDDAARSGSVGVRMSWPLFNGGLTASRTREQRAQRSAALLDRTEAERRVREQVTAAWTGLDAARAARASAEEQVRASEVATRGVRLEQEVGLRTTAEALDQEQDLLTARLALAATERDLLIAERQLLAAMGVLGQEGVLPEPANAPQNN